MPLPESDFEAFDAQGRAMYHDQYEVTIRLGMLRASCPHGWSVQPRDRKPDEALTAHLDACPECKHRA